MGLAITDEHRELADVANKLLTSQGESLAREVMDGGVGRLNALWSGMVAQGWPGLHLDERFGGQGYGHCELAIVLAESARFAAPGPLAATAAVSGVIARCGSDEQKARYLPGLADGSCTAAIALGGNLTLSAGPTPRSLTGTMPGVLSGTTANLLAIEVGSDVILVEADCAALTVRPLEAVDRTLGVVAAELAGASIEEVAALGGAAPALRALGRMCFAADALGIAQATLQAAVDYAKDRTQFGRPIGSFQAIKHHCANMAVKAELATAAVWHAARSTAAGADFELAAAAAAAVAFDAAVHNAQLNIQIHGGMGFTWEHDAHIFLRRAIAIVQLMGPLAAVEDATFRLTEGGAGHDYTVTLPPDAERHRAEVRDFVAQYRCLDRADARALAVRTGYLAPHWPKPYGRAADAVEQLVIDEETASITLPGLGIGGWIMQTVLEHGTAEQIERWLLPALMGEDTWCQLFSEPGAGSDAAAVTTRAVRVDGGWSITGHKMWTSGAQSADRGLATVRTDSAAPKRKGLTTVVVDMHATGVNVCPLREMTGQSLFNEVFLDSVFVADDDVLGTVGAGWTVAMATLGNERVTIGGGAHQGLSARELINLLASSPYAGDAGMQRRIGALLAEEHGLRLLGVRRAVRALAEAQRGREGNVAKLLAAEHAQRTSALALEFSGAASALGGCERVTFEYLFDRCLTIGGGTSEISRNVIAERLLGLPRDTAAQ